MSDLFFFPETITNNYIIRLLVASLFGAIIGFERDLHGRAAGLRTNLLVSLGAAVFMIISENISMQYNTSNTSAVLKSDPGRIAAQIVTGIGFLGAGAIIKMGFSVRGLTTAACLWLSAGIGMSSGAGFFGLSLFSTLLALFTLVVLNKFEKMYSKDSYRILDITASDSIDISEIIEKLRKRGLKILYFENEKRYTDKTTIIKLTIKINHKGTTDKLAHIIISDIEQCKAEIFSIKWHKQ